MCCTNIIDLKEAFVAQALAGMGECGLADNDIRIKSLGGTIALGHPLGASGQVTDECGQIIAA